MGAYIAIAFNKVKDYELYFHIGFIIAFLLLVLSEYLTGNFNLSNFYKPQGSRGVFLSNANYYSYMSFFANFSICSLHLKYKNRLTLIGLVFIPLLALAMSFATQSRSGLLFVLIINVAFWFWVNKDKKKHTLKRIVRQIFLFVMAAVFAYQFINYYTQSSIRSRISENDEGGREYLFIQGLNVFMEYPLTGVGAGNFVNFNKLGLFTHSSYPEALSEHGLFIGGIIIMVFILPFYKSLRLLRQFNTNEFVKLNFLFFATFLVFNNVYVFYKTSYAMMYFFLMISVYYKLVSNKNKLSNG
ncbi:O-antigen ligase family protein [Flavobacteriaceae bacterium KMM 6898]|nr:O-antigen ligase family protein [Flavobacteriaceae bacterium KMM 6898]